MSTRKISIAPEQFHRHKRKRMAQDVPQMQRGPSDVIICADIDLTLPCRPSRNCVPMPMGHGSVPSAACNVGNLPFGVNAVTATAAARQAAAMA